MIFKKKAAKRPAASAKLPPISFDKLPPDIAATLRATAKRIKGIVKLRGGLAVAAALLIAILSIMALDAMVTIYSSGVRWALWGAGLSAAVITAWQTLIKPLSKPFTPGRIAGFIEANHPELEERLSTVVELLSQPGGADEGAAQLLGILTTAAVADAKNLSPRKEFTTRTVKPKLIAAGVAAAVLGALFAKWPVPTGRLIGRAIMPSAEIDNVYADNLSVEPGSVTVLQGSPLAINLAINGGWPGSAYLRTLPLDNSGGAKEVAERLVQTSSEKNAEGEALRKYQHVVPAVSESFKYRISCGSALTKFHTVTAVPRPAWKKLVIKKIFPAYTGVEPVVNSTDELAIEAVAGTRIQISVEPERELTPRFSLGTNTLSLGAGSSSSLYNYEFKLTPETAGAWRLELFDSNSFTNEAAWRPVRCVPDLSPAIELTYPEKLVHLLPPYSKLPFSYLASDDFGIAAVEMRMSVDNGPFEKLRNAELHSSTNGALLWEGEDYIDLAKIKAQPGQKLRIQLVALDNLPPEQGPQMAFAPAIEITIDATADSFAEQLLAEQYENMEKAVDQIKTDLEAAKKEAEEALKKIDENKDPDAIEKADQSKQEIQKAEEKVRELMAKTEDSLFENMIPDMQRLLEKKIEPAEEQAEKAVTAEKEDRRKEVEKLIEKLEDALDKVEDLKQDIEEQKDKLEEAIELNDLVNKQEALAENAMEMKPEDFMNQEQQIHNDFNEQTENLPSPLEEAIKEIDELKNKVDDLQEKQEDVKKALENNDADKLKELTPDMPEDSSLEDRAKQAQKDIAEAAAEIKDEISAISDMAKNAAPQLSDPATQPLDQAAREMQNAQNDANEAADQLEQDNKPQAGEEMKEAADDMENASDQLRNAKQEMQKLAEKLAEMAQQERQDALDAMEEAMKNAGEGEEPPPPPEGGEGQPPPPPPPGGMEEAKKNAEKAAEAMRQLAQQQAQQAGLPKAAMPGKPMPGPKAKGETKPQNMPASPANGVVMPDQLRRLPGMPAWFTIKGNMSNESIDDALRSVPPEYRELVRAYFTELSKQK